VAVPASSKRKAAPAQLRIVGGRGVRKDGIPTDSGGRPIEQGPNFKRSAPAKPDDLSPDAAALWDLVVDQMSTIGLLKPLDGPALQVACENYARWKEAVRFRQAHALLAKNSQGTVAAPWIGIEERASREFRAWAAEFGFTPAAEKALAGEVAGVDTSAGAGGNNPF
jgi:P27 family predicted phage terminase small subunit